MTKLVKMVVNELLFPLKLVVPQPIIRRIPWLTTNEDIRFEMVMGEVRGKLLDIGCGENRFVGMYRSTGGTGTGIDVYPWKNVDLVVPDTLSLPFDGGSFDTVTFIASFNHIPGREKVLKEARRILAPGGRVVITMLTPGISRIWHAYAYWDKDQHERGMKEGEVWGIGENEMKALLVGAGFKIAKHRRFAWGLNHLYVGEAIS